MPAGLNVTSTAFLSLPLSLSFYKIKLNRGGGVGWGKEEDGKRE